MGGSTSRSRNSVRNNEPARLGRFTKCPNCNGIFCSETSIEDFNAHLEYCKKGTKSTISPLACLESMQDKSYNQKVEWFRDYIKALKKSTQREMVKLRISRENFLFDSFHILSLNSKDLYREFHISFEGEIGQDAGGITKEWITELIKLLFSEEMGLFCRTKTERVSYTIAENKECYELYELAGKVLGKALFENIPVNCPLSYVLYKHILQVPIKLADLAFHDSSLYNSLKFIEVNTIENVFFENFNVKLENSNQVFELCEGGNKIQLTEENKLEYIRLRLQFEAHKKVENCLESFLRGFYAVVPFYLVRVFDPVELEILMCGSPVIDIEDWKKNTVYRGAFKPSHVVIKWFWEVVESLTQEQLSNLLKFVTGSERVPIEGFQNLKTLRGDVAKFTIEPIKHKKNYLPRAHTCFNRLDLPVYSNKADLERSLKLVITHFNLGFGFE